MWKLLHKRRRCKVPYFSFNRRASSHEHFIYTVFFFIFFISTIGNKMWNEKIHHTFFVRLFVFGFVSLKIMNQINVTINVTHSGIWLLAGCAFYDIECVVVYLNTTVECTIWSILLTICCCFCCLTFWREKKKVAKIIAHERKHSTESMNCNNDGRHTWNKRVGPWCFSPQFMAINLNGTVFNSCQRNQFNWRKKKNNYIKKWVYLLLHARIQCDPYVSQRL